MLLLVYFFFLFQTYYLIFNVYKPKKQIKKRDMLKERF